MTIAFTSEQDLSQKWQAMRIAEVTGKNDKQENFGELKKHVRLLMADGRPRTIADVSKALSADSVNARARLMDLVREGSVVREKTPANIYVFQMGVGLSLIHI